MNTKGPEISLFQWHHRVSRNADTSKSSSYSEPSQSSAKEKFEAGSDVAAFTAAASVAPFACTPRSHPSPFP